MTVHYCMPLEDGLRTERRRIVVLTVTNEINYLIENVFGVADYVVRTAKELVGERCLHHIQKLRCKKMIL
jgi:hypothetical protein